MTKKTLSARIWKGLLSMSLFFALAFWGGQAKAAGDVPISQDTFPNEAFRNYVETKFDTNGDKVLSAEEANAVTKLNLSDEGLMVNTLKGIEHFPELEELHCSFCEVEELDVSQNPKLKILDCAYNENLASIDVTHNPLLEILFCYETKVGTIDVSNNPGLIRLDCNTTPVTSLDVSHNPKLFALNFSGTGVSSIDVSQNPNLYEIYTTDSKLEQLDVSHNPELVHIWVNGTKVTNLDVSHNPKLAILMVANTGISSLDLRNNTGMQELYCYNTHIGSLDLTAFPAFKTLECYNTPIQELNLRNNPNLAGLDCSKTQIQSLDLSQNPNLKRLECAGTPIHSLDISNLPLLRTLNVKDTQIGNLATLDLRHCKGLENLTCDRAGIKEILFAQGAPLATMTCSGNGLAKLDMGGYTGIWGFAKENVAGQKREVNAPVSKDVKTFDFKTISTDLSKITVEPSSEYTYDPASGILTMPKDSTAEVKYTYQTGLGNVQMDVALKVNPLMGEWKLDSTGWWYRFGDGTYPVNKWEQIDGQRYYFDERGYALCNNWKNIDGTWYYFDGSCKAVTGWQFIGGSWYLFDGQTCAMKTGWAKDGDTWYFLSASGAMLTGWFNDGTNWYYLNPSGAMLTGWLYDGRQWYFLDKESGAMRVGWVKDGDAWYFLQGNGAMFTGWLQQEGNWYYLTPSGAMLTGWIYDKGQWYFLDKESGAMRVGWVKDGDTKYFLQGNGAMFTGWLQQEGNWYYLNPSGAMLTGWVYDGKHWYFMDRESGAMKVGWVKDENEWYFLQGDGAMLTGWLQGGNTWYYLKANGAMAANTIINIGGKDYRFDGDGAWIEKPEEVKDNEPFHGKWVVDTKYALTKIGSGNTIFVDSRGEAAAKSETISGAIATTWQDWSEMSVGQGNAGYATYLPANKISEILGKLGLSKDKEIIIFGETKDGWGDDIRLMNQLLACDYPDVKIVDGGYTALKKSGAPTAPVNHLNPVSVKVDSVDTSKIVTTEELQKNYKEYKILDVRSKEEYDGATLYGEPKGGHLKGAIHFPYTSLFRADGTLKSNQEIQKMLKDAGIEPQDKIVAYCTGGIRSAYMQAILEMCGYEHSYNYIESFWRWSAVGEVE